MVKKCRQEKANCWYLLIKGAEWTHGETPALLLFCVLHYGLPSIPGPYIPWGGWTRHVGMWTWVTSFTPPAHVNCSGKNNLLCPRLAETPQGLRKQPHKTFFRGWPVNGTSKCDLKNKPQWLGKWMKDTFLHHKPPVALQEEDKKLFLSSTLLSRPPPRAVMVRRGQGASS